MQLQLTQKKRTCPEVLTCTSTVAIILQHMQVKCIHLKCHCLPSGQHSFGHDLLKKEFSTETISIFSFHLCPVQIFGSSLWSLWFKQVPKLHTCWFNSARSSVPSRTPNHTWASADVRCRRSLSIQLLRSSYTSWDSRRTFLPLSTRFLSSAKEGSFILSLFLL